MSYQDPITPAKIIKEFSDGHENLKIKAGILGNKILLPGDIKYLAQLPSKEQLIVKLMIQLKSPIVGLVNTLAGQIKKLIYVIEAIKKNK